MLTISIPFEIQQQLIQALIKSGSYECGGVLMGEHIGINHFRVSSLTVQKTGAIASFVRGITDAIKAIQEVASESLPIGYGYEFSGMTREEISAGGQTLYIFLLCLIFVYFLLAAQYESYMLPFAVLLSLPVGLAGAYIFAYFFNVIIFVII